MSQRHRLDLNVDTPSLIKSLRGLSGQSQGELALSAGIARSTVANAEDTDGQAGTERRTLVALMFALGATSPKDSVEVAIDAAGAKRHVRITSIEFEVTEE